MRAMITMQTALYDREMKVSVYIIPADGIA